MPSKSPAVPAPVGFGERWHALVSAVEDTMLALRIDPDEVHTAEARRRAKTACARALGGLAWLTELVSAIRADLGDDDRNVSSPSILCELRPSSISIH